ncbi:MAG TPA: hypothetical protein VNH44_03435 [Micropepsaceae bacterium]|nr:hypothetical protein [Micropepsaceae bacterium]
MRAHLRYLAVCLLALPLPILLGFALAKSSYFYRHSSNVIDILHDRQFDAAGIDADLLLVGESALLVGVEPRRIEAATGLRTYNLSTSVLQFVAAPDLLVDRYLAKNRAPRLIVLYIAPWTRVNPPFPYSLEWTEGTKAIVRYASLPDIAQFLTQHPETLLKVPRQVWRRLVFQFDRNGNTYRNVVNGLQQDQGWFAMNGPVLNYPELTLKDGCARIDLPIVPDTTYIDHFRRRLEARGIAVAVYIAPVPDCDPLDRRAERAYAGIADNEPYQLAHRHFIDDQWHVHLDREGADENTAKVVEFVRSFVARNGLIASARNRTSIAQMPQNVGQ